MEDRQHQDHPPAPSLEPGGVPLFALVLRAAFGGTLMGLANLVPGISGGTMLLAAGVYRAFVAAIAELTRLRFRFRSILTLGTIVCAAFLSIVLFAEVVKNLVVDSRWIMYSLFIGLTLGGVPLVWSMARRAEGSRIGLWAGAAAGFGVMVALAFAGGDTGSPASASFPMLLLAGVAGASAMILPGVSGGYLLLVLGQYVPILASISRLKDALQAGDLEAAFAEWTVVVPVGLGVAVGVVGVANLIRYLLARFERPTLGVLLGLLVGAVAGLYPFQQPVEPPTDASVTIKGVLVTPETIDTIEREDWPVVFFTPTPGQVAGAVGLIVLGFGVTRVIELIGEPKKKRSRRAAAPSGATGADAS